MSRVLVPDNVEASHWRYVAQVMEECLEKIIESKSIKKGDIPSGIYDDVRKFFDFALAARGFATPENPRISMENYRIAADALKSFRPELESDQKLLERNLESSAKLFKGLKKERVLKDRGLNEITDLKKFFHQIYLWADSKTYESAVAFKQPF